MYRVLSKAQVDQFIEVGYVKLEEAFPRNRALQVQEFVWERLAERGVRKDDRSTWTEPVVHIKENYNDPVFHECATERLADAVEDLVGEGRWRTREKTGYWGWWPVNFSKGADQPWDVPIGGWHWDGQHFQHFVDAPDQGLLLLCFFSEVRSRGGATLVAEGSHEVVARFLNRHPEGLELREAIQLCSSSHPWLAELTGKKPEDGVSDPYAESPEKVSEGSGRIERFMGQTTVDEDGTSLRVVEPTASPGDVLLCHPFLYHAASQNHLGVPRFICNRTTPLKEKMRFHRPNGDYSPVETSIRRALHR
jgi:hypothetical protein